MKFLVNHRKDVLALINKHGLSEQDFSFVKRKGRINIIHESSGRHFAYIRKKETAISETDHRWEEKEYYKVQQDEKKEIIIDTWESVSQSLKMWLTDLSDK